LWSVDWAKIFGGAWVRDGSRRKDSGTPHQEDDCEQEEVKDVNCPLNGLVDQLIRNYAPRDPFQCT
jgi:hypothetical protein